MTISAVSWSVHPHVCGEHFLITKGQNRQYGSSPRVWGTFLNNPSHKISERFIPTCVGNIPASCQVLLMPSVHPHVCGEHHVDSCISTHTSGSSPRVWGTFDKLTSSEQCERFIPTCVGNMRSQLRGSARPAVHPHVCGEHSCMRLSQSGVCGSSPRVWGT